MNEKNEEIIICIRFVVCWKSKFLLNLTKLKFYRKSICRTFFLLSPSFIDIGTTFFGSTFTFHLYIDFVYIVFEYENFSIWFADENTKIIIWICRIFVNRSDAASLAMVIVRRLPTPKREFVLNLNFEFYEILINLIIIIFCELVFILCLPFQKYVLPYCYYLCVFILAIRHIANVLRILFILFDETNANIDIFWPWMRNF